MSIVTDNCAVNNTLRCYIYIVVCVVIVWRIHVDSSCSVGGEKEKSEGWRARERQRRT